MTLEHPFQINQPELVATPALVDLSIWPRVHSFKLYFTHVKYFGVFLYLVALVSVHVPSSVICDQLP